MIQTPKPVSQPGSHLMEISEYVQTGSDFVDQICATPLAQIH